MAGETFTSDDIALLTEALSLDDILFAAAHAAKLIESSAAYPINSLNQLRAVFHQQAAADELIYVGRCILSWEKVEQYFGKSRFPIQNRTKLLSALIVSLKKGLADTVAPAEGRHAVGTR